MSIAVAVNKIGSGVDLNPNTRRIISRTAAVVYLIAIAARVFSGTYSDYIKIFPFPTSLITTPINQYLTFALFATFLLDVCANGISVKKVIFGVVGVVATQSVCAISYDASLVYICWFILAYPKNCDLRMAVRCFWVSGFMTMGLVFLSCALGLQPDIISYEHGVIRHSFGFANPNATSVFVTCFALALTYDLSKDWHWWYGIEILTILVAFLYFSNGRMSFILGLLYLSYVAFINIGNQTSKIKRGINRAVCLFAQISFPLLALICLVFSWVWSTFPGRFGYSLINNLLNGRPAEMVKFYDTYGLHLQGQKIEQTSPAHALSSGNPMNALDNAFLLAALKYGLVVFALLIVLCVLLAKNCKSTNDYSLSFLIIIMAFFGLTEVIVFNIARDVLFFAAGYAFSNFSKKPPPGDS